MDSLDLDVSHIHSIVPSIRSSMSPVKSSKFQSSLNNLGKTKIIVGQNMKKVSIANNDGRSFF